MEKRFLMCLYLFFFLIFCTCVSASDLLVSPQVSELGVVWYNSKSFNLTVFNQGNVPLYNVGFGNVSYMSFPSVFNLSVNESKIVYFSVLTNELFNGRLLSSLVSYFVVGNYSPDVRVWDVNITGQGFVGLPSVFMVNDSVRWNNLLSVPVVVKGLGGGFQDVSVPALSNVVVSYFGVGELGFYLQDFGFTGNLLVLNRSSVGLVHNSGNDVFVHFSLSSVIGNGTLSVTLLSSNIVVDNNETYREALVEVRNHDANLVVRNISLSGNRWVSNISVNNFDLAGGGIKRILFDVTPLVLSTNETNRSQDIVLSLNTSNAGVFSKVISVFVNYENLDLVTVNGTTYNLIVLGINQTIEACVQHMEEPGYEPCQLLKRFGVNQTIIREVTPEYKIPEGEMLRIRDSMLVVGNVSYRMENEKNLVLDRQDLLDNKTDYAITMVINQSQDYAEFKEMMDAKWQRLSSYFWSFFGVVVFVVLFLVVIWVLDNVAYLNAMEEGRQV